MGVNGVLLSAPCPTLPQPSPRGRALCSYFIRRSCDLILLTTSDQQAVSVAPSTGWSVGIRSLADCCVRIFLSACLLSVLFFMAAVFLPVEHIVWIWQVLRLMHNTDITTGSTLLFNCHIVKKY